MDDPTKPHRARVGTYYLRDESITTLPWPARSPDLNPIEHIWDIIGRRLKERTPPVQTLNELEQTLQLSFFLQVWTAVLLCRRTPAYYGRIVVKTLYTMQQEWQRLTQVQIRRLVGSMRRRLATVIRVNGSYTNY